jgi:hypothetical protein
MSKILDIDLDYLNLCSTNEGSGFLRDRTPEEAFDDLIDRANPDAKMTMSIEHHEAYHIWDALVDNKDLTRPRQIIHVDEHHDLYNKYEDINCANFVFHALNQWPACKVTWVASHKSGNTEDFYWGFHKSEIKRRFKTTVRVPRDMSKVDLISVTASPDYTKGYILSDILRHIEKHYAHRIIGQFPTPRRGKNQWPDNYYPSNWTMRGVRK